MRVTLSTVLCLVRSKAVRIRAYSGSRPISTTSLSMTSAHASIPHVVRTAHEPRQAGTWHATVSKIEPVNRAIRCIRLSLGKDQPPPLHLPGQYVDLHIPGIPTVGGFTITSPPQNALSFTSTTAPEPAPSPYIELAIQKSTSNPPAAYLWQPPSTIMNSPVSFQVGGRFTYPPLALDQQECAAIENAVFVAGGVGINPIMSMVSAMNAIGNENSSPSGGGGGGMVKRVRVLYSSRRSSSGGSGSGSGSIQGPQAEKILFEDRLVAVAKKWKADPKVDYEYTLFETQHGGQGIGQRQQQGEEVEEEGEKKYGEEKQQAHRVQRRRIGHQDLLAALGPESLWANTVVYVCGVPQMTDEFTDFLRKQKGLEDKRILCEKWW